MAAKRLPMRKIREILRLKHEVGLSHRAIARACSVGVGTVSLYVGRAREAGLTWPLPEEMDEAALEARLLRGPRSPTGPRPQPDPAHIHRELKRQGVTLHLLWVEYLETHPAGYPEWITPLIRFGSEGLFGLIRAVGRATEGIGTRQGFDWGRFASNLGTWKDTSSVELLES